MCECVYVQHFTYFLKINPWNFHTQCNFTRTCVIRGELELSYGRIVYYVHIVSTEY